MLKNYDKILKTIFRLNDVIIMALALLTGHIIRFGGPDIRIRDLALYFFSILVWLLITNFSNFYRFRKESIMIFISNIQVSLLFFLAISMFAFFFKSADFSRLMLIYYASSMFVYLIISHYSLISILRKTGQNPEKVRNVLIIGAGRLAEEVTNEIAAHPEYGLRITGYIEDDMRYAHFKDRVLGKLTDLEMVLKEFDIQEVIITLPLIMAEVINVIIRQLELQGVRVQLVPDLYRFTKRAVSLNNMGRIPMLTIHSIPMDNIVNRIIKRSFDVIFSLVVLIVLSPLLLFIAILVKVTSRGPVFFIQARTGYSKKRFRCLKFRSMRITDPKIADEQQCADDDERRTSLGKFLRKTNLDELPQFLNVLKGDMSVVGPRPHMLSHTEEFKSRVNEYLVRHYVKPGITGWAQVHGWRGPTDTDEKLYKRIEHDLWYIENWSFWLDMKITLKTIFSRQSKLNAF